MNNGEYLKKYTGPRGRINKEDLGGFTISSLVEFELDGTWTYGKIIEFKRDGEVMTAEISVKAFIDIDGKWTRYHDYFDFKCVPVLELTQAPRGVLPERTERRVLQENSDES